MKFLKNITNKRKIRKKLKENLDKKIYKELKKLL